MSNKRQPPKGVILIGFAIFCTTCKSELREVQPEDRHGDTEFCSECGVPVIVAVGLSVNANTTAELRFTMNEMEKNIAMIGKILQRWSPPE